jgi:Flp pilus assembly pilin Flp
MLWKNLTKIHARVKDQEEGQGLAEVALFLVLVVIVAVTALTDLGSQIVTTFNTVVTSLGG